MHAVCITATGMGELPMHGSMQFSQPNAVHIIMSGSGAAILAYTDIYWCPFTALQHHAVDAHGLGGWQMVPSAHPRAARVPDGRIDGILSCRAMYIQNYAVQDSVC